MKKVLSLLLVLSMVFGLCVNTFAAELSPSVDKTTVEAGETVAVTVTVDEAITEIKTMAYKVYFDNTLFEPGQNDKNRFCVTSNNQERDINVTASGVKTDEQGKTYVTISFLDPSSLGLVVNAGEFCTLYFTAKTTTSTKAGDFKLAFENAMGLSGDVLHTASETGASVTVKALAVNATVNLSAQAEGVYILPPQSASVSSDEAEALGYTDQVIDAVSTLDVLVKAHESLFEEDFTNEPQSYLALSDLGIISKIFGQETGNCGFAVNDYTPTKEEMNDYGYIGYMVNEAVVEQGDQVDFFVYQDDWATDNYVYYEDANGFAESFQMNAGEDFTLTINGLCCGWNGCTYHGYEATLAATMPLEGVELSLVDPVTGGTTSLNKFSDENGQVVLNFATPGVYILTATGTDDSNVPVIMNTIKIDARAVGVTTNVRLSVQDSGVYRLPPQMVAVSSMEAETFGFSDSVENAVSGLDVLVKAHELILGDAFTPENAKSYINVSLYGILNAFGWNKTPSHAVNDYLPTGARGSWGTFNDIYLPDLAINEGDKVAFYKIIDTSYYLKDKYLYYMDDNGFADSFTVNAGENLRLTLKGFDLAMNGNTVQGLDASRARALAVNGVALATLNPSTGELTPLNKTTNAEGRVVLNFEEPGDYFVTGVGRDSSNTPVTMNTITIHVTSGEEPDDPIEDPQPEDFSVSLSASESVVVGENVTASIAINKEYNAFKFVLTYDPELLIFNAPTATDGLSVTDNDGTITVLGYGAAQTAAQSLSFTAKAVGTAGIMLTEAYVDVADNAVDSDTPAATITTPNANVEIQGYAVTLSDDFTGEPYVQPGEDYTFEAKDKNYDYTFEEELGVIDNGDGTFTIEDVNGNLTIAAKTKTAKTFTVTVEGTGAADVTTETFATYLTDFTFTVNKDSGYSYDISSDPTCTAGENNTYTIAGATITRNIVITVNKTELPVATTTVTFAGVTEAEVAGGLSQTAPIGQDFNFTLNKDEAYTYTVKVGEDELMEADGTYTIPGEKVVADGVTVTITKTAKNALTVEVSEYLKLDGKSIYLVTAVNASLTEGYTLSYNGTAMFTSEKYDNAYCWLMISDEDNIDTVKAEAEEAIEVANATSTPVDYSGDVNKTGAVDVNDAQLAYNIYNVQYADFTTVSVEKFLRADVNGDKTVNVLDAQAVIANIITQ